MTRQTHTKTATAEDLPGAARSYQAGERRLHLVIIPFRVCEISAHSCALSLALLAANIVADLAAIGYDVRS